MDFYLAILENREMIKIIYGLIIAIICMIIVLKSDRLFRLSLHQGIRYFRNAFLFFGIGFFVRYILGTLAILEYISPSYFIPLKVIFEFFIIMAGFFLVYSLLWKKFESSTKPATSSLLNSAVIIFYLMTISIILIDYFWSTYRIMFISQIIIFTFATAISITNIFEKPDKKFLKFYFVAMLLSLVTWGLNALIAFYLDWSRAIIAGLYILNILVFFVILLGVISVTKK